MYDIVFNQVKSIIANEGKDFIAVEKVIYKVSGNHMEIHLPECRGSHYEICFRQDYTEIALHFQSTLSKNLERLNAIIPFIPVIEGKLNKKISYGKLENKDWKRIWIEQEKSNLNEDEIINTAKLMSMFIQLSYRYIPKS